MLDNKPITVRLPIELIEKLEVIKTTKGARNLSEVVRYQLEQSVKYEGDPVEKIVGKVISDALKNHTEIPVDVAKKYIEHSENSVRVSEQITKDIHAFELLVKNFRYSISNVKEIFSSNLITIMMFILSVIFTSVGATLFVILSFF